LTHGYSYDSWYKSIETVSDHFNLELFYDF
jgi:hypothetical protein